MVRSQNLANAFLVSTATVVPYTTPAGFVTIVKRLELSNNHATLGCLVSLWVKAPGVTGRVMNRINLAASTSTGYDCWWVIPAGWSLEAVSNTLANPRLWAFGAELANP
jgi:hypothetical protein